MGGAPPRARAGKAGKGQVRDHGGGSVPTITGQGPALSIPWLASGFSALVWVTCEVISDATSLGCPPSWPLSLHFPKAPVIQPHSQPMCKPPKPLRANSGQVLPLWAVPSPCLVPLLGKPPHPWMPFPSKIDPANCVRHSARRRAWCHPAQCYENRGD